MSKQEEAQTGPELVPQGGIGAATEAGASAADEELAGAVAVLDEGAPLVLFDGLVVTDGGHGWRTRHPEPVGRYGSRETDPVSQVPSDRWHAVVGEPTIADAIVDRLVNTAYRIQFDGPSMREREALPALEEAAVADTDNAETSHEPSR